MLFVVFAVAVVVFVVVVVIVIVVVVVVVDDDEKTRNKVQDNTSRQWLKNILDFVHVQLISLYLILSCGAEF